MTGGPVPPMELGPVGGNCGGNFGTCWCPPPPPPPPPAWWLGGGPEKFGGGPDIPPIWTTIRLLALCSFTGGLFGLKSKALRVWVLCSLALLV